MNGGFVVSRLQEAFEILFDLMEKHFAALKIPDAESDYKLTRAVSFSELPSTRRICVEQCYQSDNSPGLVRQYSCEQIFDKTANTRQVKISEVVRTSKDEQRKVWETTISCADTFKVPNWQSPVKHSIIKPSKFAQSQVEYMEVEDVNSTKDSTPSVSSQQISENVQNQNAHSSYFPPCQSKVERISNGVQSHTAGEKDSNTYVGLKKKLRSLVPSARTPAGKKRKMCTCWQFLFFLLLPIALVIIAALVVNEDIPVNGIPERQKIFENASTELVEKIYGQSESVRLLVDCLNENDFGIKMVSLVGGTGVGKSYTTEIVRRNFPFKDNVFVFFPPLESSMNPRMFTPYSCNLLILENLKAADLVNAVRLMKIVRALENYCITMISVFNMEEVDDDLIRTENLVENTRRLETVYQNENISAIIVGYKSLDDETLGKCIADAAKDSNLRLTNEQFERIKENLVISNTGCKGAYSKVQVIGRE